MAFRILSDEELSLLNEDERQCYKSDLAIYQQRVAFVEQLELLENAEIKPYKSQMKPIRVIGKMENKSYATPEYVVSLSAPIENSELRILPFEMVELESPILPKLSKCQMVQAKYSGMTNIDSPKLPVVNKPVKPNTPKIIKNPEVQGDYIKRLGIEAPKITSISKPNVPVIDFVKTEVDISDLPNAVKLEVQETEYRGIDIKKPSLSTVIKPQLQTDLFFETENIDLQKVQTKVPSVDIPNFEFDMSSLDKNIQHTLPKVAICFTETKVFEKTDLKEVSLSVPLSIVPVKKTFRKIEKACPELTVVEQPLTSDVSFNMPLDIEPKLSKIPKVNPYLTEFKKSEMLASDLPEIIKIATIEEQTFKAPKISKTSVMTIEPIEIKVKPIEKVKVEVTPISTVNVVEIPDAKEALKEILPIIKESLKGVGGEIS